MIRRFRELRSKVLIRDSVVNGDVVVGDKFGLDENEMLKLMQNVGLSVSQSMNHEVEYDSLRQGAQSLLDSTLPSPLHEIFPDARDAFRYSISEIKWENRRIIEHVTGRGVRSLRFYDIINATEPRHFIVAPGGSGKTHTLWNLGRVLLSSENTIPIYLSMSDFDSVDELEAFLCQVFRVQSISTLLRYHSLVFLLDGWPQFAEKFGFSAESERRKLLALLGDARIIATGRTELGSTSVFVKWDLEPLDNDMIDCVLSKAFSNRSNQQVEQVRDLVAYPLMLILYIGLADHANTSGSLLQEFQLYLTNSNDNRIELLNVLGDSVARAVLCHERVTVAAFEEELVESSGRRNVQNAVQSVHRLGTIEYKGGKVHPFHDLYWEWLLGIGVINDWESLNYIALQMPNVHSSLKLAFESGKSLDAESIRKLSSIDIVLAARFSRNVRVRKPEENKILKEVSTQIYDLMASNRTVDKYRGLIAALASCDAQYYPSILDTISLLTAQGLYFENLSLWFDANTLWEARELLFDRVKEPWGRKILVSAIQHVGGQRWSEWAESKYSSGSLTSEEAVQIALSCDSLLPKWVEAVLPTLINDRKTYYLAAAARRGKNLSLARWTASNYEQFASLETSGWYHLNDILAYCGDRALLQGLFDQFRTFGLKAQELLLYAYEKMGTEWVAKFQESYPDLLATFHDLPVFNVVSADISDEIARGWVQSESLPVQTHGWRTLIKKHQGEVLTELIEHLPSSFNDVHFVPTLKAMSDLVDAPESLLNELWSRLEGTVQPMLMQDFLCAIANIKPLGIPSVVADLRHNTKLLPDYHLSRFIGYLDKWQKETGLQLRIQDDGRDMEFGEYIVQLKLQDTEFSDSTFDLVRAMPTDTVLDKLVYILNQSSSLLAKISRLHGGIKQYHLGLVSFLLTLPDDQGINYIFDIFQIELVTFPEPALCNLLDIIEESEQRSSLLSKFLYYVSQRPTNTWRDFVSHLLEQVLQEPESSHIYRYLALILREYSSMALYDILDDQLKSNTERCLWLIRMIEEHTQILLLSEEGFWIARPS